MNAQEFGARLRELRNRAGISLRELANKVKVDFTYLSKIENGVLPPPSEKLISQLAEALNADKDELIILAGKVPSDIAQILKNRETLQRLRSTHIRQMARASKKRGRTVYPIGHRMRHLASFKGLPKLPVPVNFRSLAWLAMPVVLVLAVAASLWFAAPVRALDVSFPSLPSTGNLGSSYQYSVTVTIADQELLPIQSVKLYIYKSNNRAAYEATCPDLPLDTTSTAYTTINATGTSGTAGTVSITATAASNWAYGYDFGYVDWQGTGYYFFQPGGYGYGYGYGAGATSITYSVNWTSPGSWPAGNYKAEVKITANGKTFTKASSTFSLAVTAGGGGGGALPPTEPPTIEELEAMSDEDRAAYLQILTAEEVGGLLNEMSSAGAAGALNYISSGKAGAALNYMTTANASAAVEQMNSDKAAAALENADPDKASAIMEQLTTEKLHNIMLYMSESALIERFPRLSPEKLYSIDPQALFGALRTVPTAQLVGEITPEALEGLPDVVRVTAYGEEYLAIRTEAGEWVIVAATPAPVEKLMIKTKQALTNVKTVVEIFDEPLPEVLVGLPAGQIARAYIAVIFENITPEDIELGHMTFYVEKEWLEQNSIHKWSVFLKRYDTERNQWVSLPTKRVKEDDSKVYYTVAITRFSSFAIAGSETLPPMNFKVANLTINPAETETGETITISANVTNLSDRAETYAATLWINQTVETGTDIYLEANETRPVSFSITQDVEGVYEVRLERLFGSFSITKAPPPPPPAPAAFATSALTVSPTEVDIGETVTISTLVTNTGDLTGSYVVTLEINKVAVATKEVTLDGGTSQRITFTTTKDVAGTYTVSIDELSDTFVVKAAPPVPVKPVVNWQLVGGIFAIFIVIVMVILMTVRRGRRAVFRR